MPADVVFLDTNGLALMNASDQLHQRADAVWRVLGGRGYSIILIAEAFTTDRHFEQAGLKAMLL